MLDWAHVKVDLVGKVKNRSSAYTLYGHNEFFSLCNYDQFVIIVLILGILDKYNAGLVNSKKGKK
jgi:hypothetical protein